MSDNKETKKLTFLSDLIPIKAFVCKYIDNVKRFFRKYGETIFFNKDSGYVKFLNKKIVIFVEESNILLIVNHMKPKILNQGYSSL